MHKQVTNIHGNGSRTPQASPSLADVWIIIKSEDVCEITNGPNKRQQNSNSPYRRCRSQGLHLRLVTHTRAQANLIKHTVITPRVYNVPVMYGGNNGSRLSYSVSVSNSSTPSRCGQWTAGKKTQVSKCNSWKIGHSDKDAKRQWDETWMRGDALSKQTFCFFTWTKHHDYGNNWTCLDMKAKLYSSSSRLIFPYYKHYLHFRQSSVFRQSCRGETASEQQEAALHQMEKASRC